MARWEAESGWDAMRRGYGDEREQGRGEYGRGWRGREDRYGGEEEGLRSRDWREDRGSDWRGRGEELRPGERRTYYGGGGWARDEDRGPFERMGDRMREAWRGSDFGRDRGSQGYRGEGRGWSRGEYDEYAGMRGGESGGWGREGRFGREYGGGGYGRDEWRGGESGREGYGRGSFMGGGMTGGGMYGGGSSYGGGMYGGGGMYEQGYGREGYGREGYGREGYGREGMFGRDRDEDRGPLERMGDKMKEGFRKMTGKGPKGFKRSDDRVRDDVCERISRSWVNAENVDVKVESGEVILSGEVESREEKRMLEDLAEDVFGVEEVQNHVRIRRERGQSLGGAQTGLTGGVSQVSGTTGTAAGTTTSGPGATTGGQRQGQQGASTQPGSRH
jgi:osmotically-inducible protein OsmY